MEIINVSSKLVKPSTPTPRILRNYNISFIDKLAPTNYVCLILYYSNTLQKLHSENIYDHLEISLSQTLCEFYPFAGRYTCNVVDCGDQGALYALAKTNVRLANIIGIRHKLKSNDGINNFLPLEPRVVKDNDDPMLAIKVTTFACGGLAIGMKFAHQVADVNNICTFINNWASRSKGVYEVKKYSPVFNSTIYFPPKVVPRLDLGSPTSSIRAYMFHFSRDAIIVMGKQVGFREKQSPSPSKVQLVVALLWKAFTDMDIENNGQSKASFVAQPVEFRQRLVPKLPMNSFGNFWTLATSQLGPGKGDNLDLKVLYNILCDSVKKITKDCSKILTHGEDGYQIIIDPYVKCNQNVVDDDVNSYFFTSFCNFSFYNADFGWGKTVWATPNNSATQNMVFMLDDQQGDGVEAWVHLDEKSMEKLEQDTNIKLYQNMSIYAGENEKIRTKL